MIPLPSLLVAAWLCCPASGAPAPPANDCKSQAGDSPGATACTCTTEQNAFRAWAAVVDVPGSLDLCGQTRKMYVDYKPKGEGPHPLLISLHGSGKPADANAIQMAQVMAYQTVPGAEDFVLAHGQGATTQTGEWQSMWNVGACEAPTFPGICGEGSKIDDVAYISTAIDELVRDHNVDPDKVFIMGWSKGAGMTYRLSCELSHKIAGTVPFNGMSGWKDGQDCASDKHVLTFLETVGIAEHAWDLQKCPYSYWSQPSTMSPYFSCDSPVKNMMIVKGGEDMLCPIDGCVDATRSMPPSDFNARYFRNSATSQCSEHNEVSFSSSTGKEASCSFPNSTAIAAKDFKNLMVKVSAPDTTECRTWSGCQGNMTYCIVRASGHYPPNAPPYAWKTVEGPYARSFTLNQATVEFARGVIGLNPRTQCGRDTGGTCAILGCGQSRGATECVDHKCLCKFGQCAVLGKCVDGAIATVLSSSSGAQFISFAFWGVVALPAVSLVAGSAISRWRKHSSSASEPLLA